MSSWRSVTWTGENGSVGGREKGEEEGGESRVRIKAGRGGEEKRRATHQLPLVENDDIGVLGLHLRGRRDVLVLQEDALRGEATSGTSRARFRPGKARKDGVNQEGDLREILTPVKLTETRERSKKD